MKGSAAPAVSGRDEVDDLVDALPEDELPAASRYLASLRPTRHDSLARCLAAVPADDEPSTPEPDRAAAAGRADLGGGGEADATGVTSGRRVQRRLPLRTYELVW
jgi:hypothetical protein